MSIFALVFFKAAFIGAVLCVRGHQGAFVLRCRKDKLIQEVKYWALLAANTSRNDKSGRREAK